MNNPNKPSITAWLRQLLLISGLLPALLIIASVAALGALAYEHLLERQAGTLQQQAHRQLQETIQLQTIIVGERLTQLTGDVEAFARHVERMLQRPARLPLEQYKAFARTPQGDLYSSEENGGFAFFYSSIHPIDARSLDKLQRLLWVDPAMRDLLQRHPHAEEVFFATHDSLELRYPFSDPLERLTPGSDLTQAPTYFLADASHNPERTPVWAAPRRDPSSGQWLSACIAPVYRNDLLEGVVGLDIRTDALLATGNPIAGHEDTTLMLLASDGSLISQRTGTVAEDSVRGDTTENAAMAPVSSLVTGFSLSNSDQTTIAQQDAGILRLGPGGNQLLAWSTLPQNGWKLLTTRPAPTAGGSERLADDTVTDALLSAILVVVLILSVTTLLLMITSRRGADRLTRPLHEFKQIAHQTAAGKYLHTLPSVPFDEQRQAAQELVRLGSRLQADAQTQARSLLTLQRSCEDLEERLDNCSHELLLASHARNRLETTNTPLGGHDHLTGLPATSLFHDRAEQAIRLAERHKKPLLLLLVQVSGFIPTPDPTGENTHDLLRQATAHRLASLMRASDTIARIGHNEFALVLFDYDAEKAPGGAAQEIATRLDMPGQLSDKEASVRGEIGVSRYPQDGSSVLELLHQADAMLLLTPASERPAFTVRSGTSGED